MENMTLSTTRTNTCQQSEQSTGSEQNQSRALEMCDVIQLVNKSQPDKIISIKRDGESSLADLWNTVILETSDLSRSDRNRVIPTLLRAYSDVAADCFTAFYQFEQQHIQLVRDVMTHLLHVTGCQHDHTKDVYYRFILCGKFGGVEATGDRFEAEFAMEVERHYRLEAHHPQHELITGTECQPDDVREMAVDRLSRNVVKNNGAVNHKEMLKYLPEFGLGDVHHIHKLELYSRCVEEYTSLVEQAYRQHSTADNSRPTSVLPGNPECTAVTVNMIDAGRSVQIIY